MKARTSAAAALVLLLTTFACSPEIILHLYNGTDQDLHVTVKKKETDLLPATTMDFRHPAFVVSMGRCELAYEITELPPNEFIENRNLRRHLNLRIESDYRVFLLKAGTPLTTAVADEEQPEGFPLVPERSGGCE